MKRLPQNHGLEAKLANIDWQPPTAQVRQAPPATLPSPLEDMRKTVKTNQQVSSQKNQPKPKTSIKRQLRSDELDAYLALSIAIGAFEATATNRSLRRWTKKLVDLGYELFEDPKNDCYIAKSDWEHFLGESRIRPGQLAHLFT